MMIERTEVRYCPDYQHSFVLAEVDDKAVLYCQKCGGIRLLHECVVEIRQQAKEETNTK
jgi:Fe2+ or Zn2+ uptake regulation protein